MRLVLLLTTALVAHLAAGASWAKPLKACHHQCHAVCGNAVSQCLAAARPSCPTAPRGKAHRCLLRATHHCRKATTAHCISSCNQTGSPVCGTTVPAACVPYTSTCQAVSLTPVAVSSPADQLAYAFDAHAGNPGPGGCCVIDTCAGITQFHASAGGVNIGYREVVFLDPFQHRPDNGQITTQIGVSCPVGIPTSVYARSDIYRVEFRVDPRFSLPPAPPEWRAPYVASAGDLSVSIDSADDPLPSNANNSFTPSTWRFVNQTVGIDKVCAEQQLMQGHATASFIKNDGTPCTVTIYGQGTRVVAGQ